MRVALLAVVLSLPMLRMGQGDSLTAASGTGAVVHRHTATTSGRQGAALWIRLPFSRALLARQRALTERLTDYLMDLQQAPDMRAVALLLMVAFLYGIVHSLGPGHAKVLFVSHTVANPTALKDTWLAGTLFALVHTGSAVGVFFVARMLFGTVGSGVGAASRRMLPLSGALVVVAGVLLLLSPRIERALQPAPRRLVRGATSLNALAAVAGLAPCPGAFLILVYANFVHTLAFGLLAVIAVSAGMALTVSTTATVGGLLSGVLQRVDRNEVMGRMVHGVRILAACVILLLGVVMLTG